jgi:phospholipid/cholesterol/gamma-HCH transport system substrate-binding protein
METKARYALIGVFTLAVILASFAFVYWLQTSGGIGKRSVYRIEFQKTVSGLLVGSGVLFNGIRVGEVTSLDLDPSRPQVVTAAVAINPGTPIRDDTTVGMDFQGLTGAPVVVLTGGAATANSLTPQDGKPPLLIAAPDSTQTLYNSANDTLGRIDKVISENATSFHDAVEGISKFAQALARNSDRVDGILAGLERMTGGSAGKQRAPVFSLTAGNMAEACSGPLDTQLIVPEPSAPIGLSGTDKIPIKGVLRNPGIFDNGQLADTVPALLQAKIIETLENARCFRSVTRDLPGLQADLQLFLDVRTFAIEQDGAMKADVDVSAKVLSNDGKNLDTKVIRYKTPLAKEDAAGAATALDTSFGKMLADLLPWIRDIAATYKKSGIPSP